MAENSKIEWCDHTFNPWMGCTKISPGCDRCYAEARMDTRLHRVQWGAGQPRQRTKDWSGPKRWNKAHAEFYAQHGRRQRVFCASLADVFDNQVPPEWRADLFRLIDATPHLDWLLLTKRIGNVTPMLREILRPDTMPPNIWLGATVVDQEEADRDIPKLLATPARVRFLSMEPLLGPVQLTHLRVNGVVTVDALRGWAAGIGEPRPLNVDLLTGHVDARTPAAGPRIDWLIVGGESGHGARPMHPDWARSLRDQCAAAGVPFLFKQWGEWLPAQAGRSVLGKTLVLEGAAAIPSSPAWHGFADGQRVARVGKKAAGRLLDGRAHDEFPEVVHGQA